MPTKERICQVLKPVEILVMVMGVRLLVYTLARATV